MQINILAPLQALVRPKNQFSLFFVAFFIAKLLHLGSHASSLPILLYVLYFPTFLIPDVVLLVSSKLVIYTQHSGQTSALKKILGCLLAVFTAACSAAQISFFIETGGEIQWMAASRVLGGSGGLGLILSGLPAMGLTFTVIYGIAWTITPKFYDFVERILQKIGSSFGRVYQLTKRTPKADGDQVPLISLMEEQTTSSVTPERSVKRPQSTKDAITISVTTLTAIVVLIVLQIIRPISPPYAHMSGSLPITLIEAVWFQPINSEFCLPHPLEAALFPFERFNKFYNHTHSSNWLPQSEMCSRANSPGPPPWLEYPGGHGPQKRDSFETEVPAQAFRREFFHGPPPHDRPPPGPPPHSHPPPGPPLHGRPPHGPPPDGHPHRPPPDFLHDENRGHRGHGHEGGYEPICDPLKISNLNARLIENLAESIVDKRPKIKNILLLTLESTRKDMFPLKKNSHIYKTILSSYNSPNATAELDAKLASITKTAAFLSGESTGFESFQEKHPAKGFRTLFKEKRGGINVEGAISQAAYTLKSLLSSHCGVEPLPVDFTEETRGEIYQPCMPQILEMMNLATHKADTGANQESGTSHVQDSGNNNLPAGASPEASGSGRIVGKVPEKDDYRSFDWESTMVQSVTDQFDSQDILDAQMGFRNVIAETTISKESSKHFPPKHPWVNYFGYPEVETLDYLRDLFVDAQHQGKRVFVSHLTSTPHHPFATPKDWTGKTAYIEKQRWRPEDPFDAYLNTIKYQDEWVAQIFEMLYDTGVLNETLVVMTGDHGLAFKSVDLSQSAVNNGHISNFAIPLLFIHPDLPRMQVVASTTPMSILPTVFDLLLQTNSLDNEAVKLTNELLPRYQGNSLIRKLDYSVATDDGSIGEAFFQPFHFSIINPGGSLLAISDASTTFRLILPLCSAIPLRFTDIYADPKEREPIIAWTMDELIAIIKVRHGVRAKEWVQLAEELGRWWFWNQRAKWGYWESTRSTSRGGSDGAGRGRVKLKHWWETK